MDFGAMLITFLVQAFQKVFKVNWFSSIPIAGIISVCWNSVQNPEGAINQAMTHMVDLTVGQLPSTPHEYQYWTVVGNLASAVPSFGWGAVNEMLSGSAGMVSIFLAAKAVKFVVPGK